MGSIRFFIFLAALMVARARAQTPSDNPKPAPQSPEVTGTVCVLPNSPDRPTRISSGGEYDPATLTIGIDKQPPISWPHKQTAKIENLSLDGRHLIVLRSESKRIQSFWFRFSAYQDTKLCVYFDGYQGVQFGDKHTTYWCRCK
jgi:hypothetical protein